MQTGAVRCANEVRVLTCALECKFSGLIFLSLSIAFFSLSTIQYDIIMTITRVSLDGGTVINCSVHRAKTMPYGHCTRSDNQFQRFHHLQAASSNLDLAHSLKIATLFWWLPLCRHW